MLKIGEFSQLAQISVRMLRHYDQLGLLRPSFIDEWTGYRYYEIAQLPRLNRILALNKLGFSLEEIGGMLEQEIAPAELAQRLSGKALELEHQIAAEEQRLRRIRTRLLHLQQEGAPQPYDVVIKQQPAVWVAGVRTLVPTLDAMGHMRCELLDALHGWVAAHNIEPSGPELMIYHTHEYIETDIDTEAAIIVPASASAKASAPIYVYELPAAPTLACCVYQGPVHTVIEPISAIMRWICQHSYSIAGPPRELHLSGYEQNLPLDPTPSGVLELQIPITAAAYADRLRT